MIRTITTRRIISAEKGYGMFPGSSFRRQPRRLNLDRD